MDKILSTTKLLFSFVIVILAVFAGIKIVDKAYEYRYSAFLATTLNTNIKSSKEVENELACLTRNIYYEAGSEPFEGKVAVAQVTLNRTRDSSFPSSVCGVVYQKNIFYNKVVCQFSWYCEHDSRIKPVYAEYYKESEAVAKKVLLEGFRLDSLDGALYYHADYVNPNWHKQKIIKIGHHIFYR